jgi:hypothetical protein
VGTVPMTVPASSGGAGAILNTDGAGNTFFVPVSGDGTLAGSGALTVTKTAGVPFAPSATTDTTNATNISSGTLSASRLSAPNVNQLLGTVYTVISATGVNLNSVADTQFSLVPPTGYTRWNLKQGYLAVSDASVSLSAAKFGLFTAAAGGGTAVIASGTVLSGITSAADGTSGNFATFSDASTRAFTVSGFPSLFFRVTTAQGAPATANVALVIAWLP